MTEIKTDKGKVIGVVTAADPNIHGCDEGIWVEVKADDGTRPTICLIKDKPDGTFDGDWYIGMYRDARNAPLGCDLALRFTKDGPCLQLIKGKEVKIIHLFDLFTSGVDVHDKKRTDVPVDSGVTVDQGVEVTLTKGNIAPQYPSLKDNKVESQSDFSNRVERDPKDTAFGG